MNVTNDVYMDLTHPGLPVCFAAMQGDSARQVCLHLTEDGQAWNVPEGAVAVVHYKCSDGTGGSFDTLPEGEPAYTAQGNRLTVRLPALVFGVPGLTRVWVSLLSGGAQLSTFCFSVQIGGTAVEPGQPYANLSQWLGQEGMEQVTAYLDMRLGVLENGAY